MDFIEINKDTCTRCGDCAVVCPDSLIFFRKGSYPRTVLRAEFQCLKCGHCVAACPTGSLVHRDVHLEESPVIKREFDITPEQCEQLIKSRRSIRAYQDKAVPREVIERLIGTARYAPTGHNSQEIEWLVIDSPPELRRMEAIGVEWLRYVIKEQPRFSAMIGMKDLLERQEKKPDMFLRGAPVLVVAHGPDFGLTTIDATIALSYFNLFAESLGLGCCWAGFIYMMANGFQDMLKGFQPMKDALALPEGHIAGGCMMLGYPVTRYHRVPMRKQPRITWSRPRPQQ